MAGRALCAFGSTVHARETAGAIELAALPSAQSLVPMRSPPHAAPAGSTFGGWHVWGDAGPALALRVERAVVEGAMATRLDLRTRAAEA